MRPIPIVPTALLVATAFATWANAAPIEFDCKDPKGVHSIAFTLDSKLEPIMGLASGISGKVSFDPAAPEKTTGRIVVEAKSLHTPNGTMKKYLHGPDWMDVEHHPNIEFTIKSVKKSKKIGENRYELTVKGEFTCKGITKKMIVPVTLTYLPGMLSQRQRGIEGDLIVIRAEFPIARKDFNIKPDMGPMVVSEEIEVRVAIVGGHPK